MRFGIGKRVGGMYVGASVSGSSILKFIYWFFAWPFYLAYFMLVWPCVKLYKYFKGRRFLKKEEKAIITAAIPQTVTIDSVTYTMSSAEARSMIQRKKEIADDSIRLVQETKNPDVFFERLEKASDSLRELAAAYTICGVENNAEEVLQKFNADREGLINNFIQRYAKDIRRKIYELSTQKGKSNKADVFRNVLLEYEERMSEENLEYMENLYAEVKGLAE